MEFSKDQVVELLQERGQTEQATQADQELPQQVDSEQHSDLLAKFGVDPQELATKFGGGLLG
jgi:DNA-binding protein H-NS